mmetsp:Transcript_20979/g.58321  ORF Transcript_20979/g.58321 Transcript_20979/m.58321 type:complete len:213 (+) Transcript_20979:369-1007(+)
MGVSSLTTPTPRRDVFCLASIAWVSSSRGGGLLERLGEGRGVDGARVGLPEGSMEFSADLPCAAAGVLASVAAAAAAGTDALAIAPADTAFGSDGFEGGMAAAGGLDVPGLALALAPASLLLDLSSVSSVASAVSASRGVVGVALAVADAVADAVGVLSASLLEDEIVSVPPMAVGGSVGCACACVPIAAREALFLVVACLAAGTNRGADGR